MSLRFCAVKLYRNCNNTNFNFAHLLTSKRCASNIKIILLQDIENRGKKGDIIEVKRGFARNCLIPKKLASKLLLLCHF